MFLPSLTGEIKMPGAGVLLHNGKKILLVCEKASKLWGIPKGHQEDNESYYDCWKRELKEETGIVFLPRYKIITESTILRYKIVEARLLTDYLPETIPGDEILETRWVNLNMVLGMNLNAITRMAFRSTPLIDSYRSFRSVRKIARKYSLENKPIGSPRTFPPKLTLISQIPKLTFTI